MKILVTGYTLKNHWTIHMENQLDWKAFITDEADPDTGAPVLESYGFESLVEKIEVFEKGQSHGE